MLTAIKARLTSINRYVVIGGTVMVLAAATYLIHHRRQTRAARGLPPTEEYVCVCVVVFALESCPNRCLRVSPALPISA